MAEPVHHVEIADNHAGHKHDYPPPVRVQGTGGRPKPFVGPNYDAYKKIYDESVGPNSDDWWAKQAREYLSWFSDFKTVQAGGFEAGDIQWL